MHDKEKFPKWIRIDFQPSASDVIKGFTFSANYREMILERIYRSKIKEPEVINFTVDGIKVADNVLKKIFEEVVFYGKELEEIEARKKIEQEAEDAVKRGKTKSR